MTFGFLGWGGLMVGGWLRFLRAVCARLAQRPAGCGHRCGSRSRRLCSQRSKPEQSGNPAQNRFDPVGVSVFINKKRSPAGQAVEHLYLDETHVDANRRILVSPPQPPWFSRRNRFNPVA